MSAVAVVVCAVAAVSVGTTLPPCMSRTVASACCITPTSSAAVYVSQNSRLVEPCSSLRTRSGSFTPGSSTSILPSSPPRRCILGCITPKRSIRELNTLKELSIADFTSSLSTLITWSFFISKRIFSFNAKVENIVERRALGSIRSNSCLKTVRKSLELRFLALSRACLKIGVLL